MSVQGGEILGLWLPTDANFAYCLSNDPMRRDGLVLSGDPDVPRPAIGQTFNLSGARSLDLNESANLQGVGSPPPPTWKDQCNNGGWRSFPQFKNQGDCVSLAATGGNNPPGG
jgi:hypothetical protein